MWNFLSGKKNKTVPEFIPLYVDIHSHIIPGIDDGAQTAEESLALIHGLMDAGYRKFIATPHIYPGLYNNTTSTISVGLQKLRSICKSNALDVEVNAAAEYFFDNHFFELAEKKELLTFGDQYVLFELPMNSRPNMVEDIIFKMNLNGYKPVLAHPERYPYYHDKQLRDYQLLKDHGVFFQLNLMSLTGYYNDAVKRAARNLIKAGMVDFAGSDIHKAKHLAVIHAAQQDKYYLELLESGKLQNNSL